MENILQWSGCVFGILGSLFLALNNKRSGYGFVLFIFSNIFWLAFGLLTKTYGLVVTQVFFMFISGLGIYKWLIKNNGKQ